MLPWSLIYFLYLFINWFLIALPCTSVILKYILTWILLSLKLHHIPNTYYHIIYFLFGICAAIKFNISTSVILETKVWHTAFSLFIYQRTQSFDFNNCHLEKKLYAKHTLGVQFYRRKSLVCGWVVGKGFLTFYLTRSNLGNGLSQNMQPLSRPCLMLVPQRGYWKPGERPSWTVDYIPSVAGFSLQMFNRRADRLTKADCMDSIARKVISTIQGTSFLYISHNYKWVTICEVRRSLFVLHDHQYQWASLLWH